MTVSDTQVKRVICIGTFKVLYGSNLKWDDIKDDDISFTFASVSNPTGWDSFFAQAVGTSIQQEMVLRGSYCPGLEQKLIDYEKGEQTWADFEAFIIDKKERCTAIP